jgi:hypothetical protein
VTRCIKVTVTSLVALASAALVQACAAPEAPSAGPRSRIPQRSKDEQIELGLQHRTAAELFEALKQEADGGRRLDPANLPDWSGVYTRAPVRGFAFDPDQPPGELSTAKLTPEYHQKLMQRIADVKQAIEWDPISTCAPPGHPRWLTEPFLRDFVVTPDQTWLINEMVNDIRRIYTDGRDHVPEEDRYPLYNGDSVGFWDGRKLVIHTNQLRAGIYQRSHPDYTDQVETVEIWEKTDERTLTVDVWVYDPPALVEPWYTKQTYVKLTDPERSLRIRYWHCGENQNNAVIQTETGSTQFQDFTFTTTDDGQGGQK